MNRFIWGSVVFLRVAALACLSGQPYTLFRPQGYDHLQRLEFGRGPDPLHSALHLTQVQAQSDLCEGLNDVVALTLPAPIVGDISPETFILGYCPIVEDDVDRRIWPPNPDECEYRMPTCARLQLEDSPNERRTLLLFGQFVKFEGNIATHSVIQDVLQKVTFLVDGKQRDVYGQYTSGQGFGRSAVIYDVAVGVQYVRPELC